MRKLILLAVFVLVSVTVYALPDCDSLQGDSSLDCGDTVSASCEMDHGLTCTVTAIKMDTDGVTLDCKGNTITGPGYWNGIEAFGVHGISILDCAIDSFGRGIEHDYGSTSTISGNVVKNCRDEGIFSGSDDDIIINNYVENTYYYEESMDLTFGVGIRVWNADGVTISNNRACSNGQFDLQHDGTNMIISGNECYTSDPEGLCSVACGASESTPIPEFSGFGLVLILVFVGIFMYLRR